MEEGIEIDLKKFTKKWNFIKKYSWLGAILSVFAMTLIRGCYYILQLAALNYWKIKNIAIYGIKEDILFKAIVYMAFGVFLAVINLYSYNLLTSDKSKKEKLKKCFWGNVKLFIMIYVISVICTGYNLITEFSFSELMNVEFVRHWFFQLIGLSIMIIFITSMPGVAFGMSFGILNKIGNSSSMINKESKSIKNAKIIIETLILVCAVIIVVMYLYGGYVARNQKDFKLLDSGEIIIYEDPNIMVVSETVKNGCSDDATIIVNNKIQKIIDKKGVRTEIKKFEKVKKLI